MNNASHLWHPINGAKQYEATGSRVSFHDKWNPGLKHAAKRSQLLSDTLTNMIAVLVEETKTEENQAE